jgi:pimeloyl-ACP methyl ester carboxylesterase
LNLEKERKIRVRLREAVKQKYPEKVKAMRSLYGIKPANKKKTNANKSDVILIHGLDEPGRIWMNLTPALLNDGFNVWYMIYPNDQPVADSAEFFLKELKSFRTKGNKTISVVAHSMGGLVTREMLTSPKLAYHKSALKGEVPSVTRFIMVGTPNGGSEMARFRIFTEFRDQLTNLFSENYSWLHGILDGAGEAGIDLIPGSSFLEKLNSRPHPKDTEMLVIAGVMSAWETEDIDKFIQGIQARLPDNTHDTAKKFGDLLNAMAHGMGDGLVSVESARLEGVPIQIVQGTHLTMIRNITSSSERTPPAIPIIMETLNKPY